MLHHLLALQGFIKLPRLPLKALTIIQLPPHHTHPVNCLYPAQVLITWWHSFWFPSLCPRQMLGQTQGKTQRCLGWLQLRTLAWAGWCHLTICNCGVDTLPGAHYCWVGKLTCFTMWIKAHSNPGFFRGWLLQAFSQGLGPKTTGGSLLRVAGIHSALYLGKAAYFRKKYLETKYSASSVAGVLRVSSLIKSTPMKSPEPLKEVTSLQPWSLPLPWPQPPPSPWRLWDGESWGSSESQFLLESGSQGWKMEQCWSSNRYLVSQACCSQNLTWHLQW